MPTPACPRCGYDQSGVVATWQHACPLRGTCSECGEAFAWADIFNPGRRTLRGFFEHARGTGRTLWWAFTTLWLTLRPWTFWRRVGADEYPLRRRAILWPIVAAAPFYVLGSLAFTAGTLVWLAWSAPPTATLKWWMAMNSWTAPIAGIDPGLFTPGYSLRMDPGRWLLLAAPMLTLCITFPLVLLTLNRLPAATRLPTRPVLRAAIYSFAWVPAAAIFRMLHALWSLGLTAHVSAGGGVGRGVLTTPPFHEIAAVVATGAVVWLAVWWWCALAAIVGRRNALKFWLAAAIPSAILAAIVLDRVLTALAPP